MATILDRLRRRRTATVSTQGAAAAYAYTLAPYLTPTSNMR